MNNQTALSMPRNSTAIAAAFYTYVGAEFRASSRKIGGSGHSTEIQGETITGEKKRDLDTLICDGKLGFRVKPR